MEKEKISVIMTTYNRRNFLEKAINSVFEQTYKNIEIIIIDDCSKDDTSDFCQNLKDSRIKFYRNERNQGCGPNRKKALEKYATGKYIIFLDDDDKFINKNYFKDAINRLEKNQKLSMVCASHIVYDQLNNTKIEKKFPYKNTVNNKEFFLNFGSENYPKPIISIAIIRKKALEFAEYKEMKILNDTTIFLRALMYGPMGFINTVSAQYLVHGNNISFSCTTEFIIDNLEEKYKVYCKIPEDFNLSDSDKKQWLTEQCDITIVYFIKGSKPTYFQFRKLLNWVKKRIDDKQLIQKYKKIYKENKKLQKSI